MTVKYMSWAVKWIIIVSVAGGLAAAALGALLGYAVMYVLIHCIR